MGIFSFALTCAQGDEIRGAGHMLGGMGRAADHRSFTALIFSNTSDSEETLAPL